MDSKYPVDKERLLQADHLIPVQDNLRAHLGSTSDDSEDGSNDDSDKQDAIELPPYVPPYVPLASTRLSVALAVPDAKQSPEFSMTLGSSSENFLAQCHQYRRDHKSASPTLAQQFSPQPLMRTQLLLQYPVILFDYVAVIFALQKTFVNMPLLGFCYGSVFGILRHALDVFIFRDLLEISKQADDRGMSFRQYLQINVSFRLLIPIILNVFEILKIIPVSASYFYLYGMLGFVAQQFVHHVFFKESHIETRHDHERNSAWQFILQPGLNFGVNYAASVLTLAALTLLSVSVPSVYLGLIYIGFAWFREFAQHVAFVAEPIEEHGLLTLSEQRQLQRSYQEEKENRLLDQAFLQDRQHLHTQFMSHKNSLERRYDDKETKLKGKHLEALGALDKKQQKDQSDAVAGNMATASHRLSSDFRMTGPPSPTLLDSGTSSGSDLPDPATAPEVTEKMQKEIDDLNAHHLVNHQLIQNRHTTELSALKIRYNGLQTTQTNQEKRSQVALKRLQGRSSAGTYDAVDLSIFKNAKPYHITKNIIAPRALRAVIAFFVVAYTPSLRSEALIMMGLIYEGLRAAYYLGHQGLRYFCQPAKSTENQLVDFQSYGRRDHNRRGM